MTFLVHFLFLVSYRAARPAGGSSLISRQQKLEEAPHHGYDDATLDCTEGFTLRPSLCWKHIQTSLGSGVIT